MSHRAIEAPPACVMGDYDLVRALALGGIRTGLLAAKPGDPAVGSRFVGAVLPLPSGAWEDETPILDGLLRWAEAQPVPPALYYQFDGTLRFVSRHRERLSRCFRFVIADADLVDDLVDKARFQRLGERLGLPLPRSRWIDFADRPDLSDLELQFPLVVKPLARNRVVVDMGGAKVMAVETPEALRALAGTGLPAFGRCLLQEMIPGPETLIESYHAYVDAGGNIVAEFTGRKIRTYPVTHGFSTALVVTDQPDVLALGRECVGLLRITGVLKADFKRGPDGRLYLLEINPRFNLWHHLGAAAGVNLPAQVHADLCGHARPASAPLKVGATWCDVRKDYAAARQSGLPVLTWLGWMLRADVKVPWTIAEPGIWPREVKRWLAPRLRATRIGGALRRRHPGPTREGDQRARPSDRLG